MPKKMRNLFVLSGPSGSGKNTVYEALRQKMPSLAQTVSATTRPARSDEKDGVDYY
ncbi:MAG: guanylate kinase, partial [Clostridia bacterium]|nr:guanylate kinase [Clostridia bacterium]